MRTFSHFSNSVILPVVIIHSSQLKKKKKQARFPVVFVYPFFSLPAPNIHLLLLRWHYPTHQTCNFNRGWQGDLDDRCSYGNRWHWQTREAAVCRLRATCAWSDWVHQLSRLPHPLHSQSDGLAQKVCCVHDNRQGASEEAVRWEGFLLSLSYLPYHNSPPSLTHVFNVLSESQRLNWFYQWEFTLWPLQIASHEGGLHGNKPSLLLPYTRPCIFTVWWFCHVRKPFLKQDIMCNMVFAYHTCNLTSPSTSWSHPWS